MKENEVIILAEAIIDAAKAQAELSVLEAKSCGCNWPDSKERDDAWENLEKTINQIFRGVEV